jgi:hypothetical protein
MAGKSCCWPGPGEDKITRDHPELVAHLEAVMETVAEPDHVEPDALIERTRFYRTGAGPSRENRGRDVIHAHPET